MAHSSGLEYSISDNLLDDNPTSNTRESREDFAQSLSNHSERMSLLSSEQTPTDFAFEFDSFGMQVKQEIIEDLCRGITGDNDLPIEQANETIELSNNALCKNINVDINNFPVLDTNDMIKEECIDIYDETSEANEDENISLTDEAYLETNYEASNEDNLLNMENCSVVIIEDDPEIKMESLEKDDEELIILDTQCNPVSNFINLNENNPSESVNEISESVALVERCCINCKESYRTEKIFGLHACDSAKVVIDNFDKTGYRLYCELKDTGKKGRGRMKKRKFHSEETKGDSESSSSINQKQKCIKKSERISKIVKNKKYRNKKKGKSTNSLGTPANKSKINPILLHSNLVGSLTKRTIKRTNIFSAADVDNKFKTDKRQSLNLASHKTDVNFKSKREIKSSDVPDDYSRVESNLPDKSEPKSAKNADFYLKNNSYEIKIEYKNPAEDVKDNIFKPKRMFHCPHCDYVSKNHTDVKNHMSMHKKKDVYSCTICPFICVDKIEYTDHILQHKLKKIYKCDLCEFMCHSRRMLKAHGASHMVTQRVVKIKHEVLDPKVLNSKDIEHLDIKTSKERKLMKRISNGEYRFKCNVCDFKAKFFSLFRQHLYKHATKSRFSCDKCNYSCLNLFMLQRHMVVHTKEKPLKCDKCSFATNMPYNLKIHKSIHKDDRPHECHICQKTFKLRLSLRTHYMVHSRINRYFCDVCNYPFNRRASLKRHLEMHQRQQKYRCPDCNFFTPLVSSIIRHRIISHPVGICYVCPLCSFSCRNRRNILNHKKVHKQEDIDWDLFNSLYLNQTDTTEDNQTVENILQNLNKTQDGSSSVNLNYNRSLKKSSIKLDNRKNRTKGLNSVPVDVNYLLKKPIEGNEVFNASQPVTNPEETLDDLVKENIEQGGLNDKMENLNAPNVTNILGKFKSKSGNGMNGKINKGNLRTSNHVLNKNDCSKHLELGLDFENVSTLQNRQHKISVINESKMQCESIDARNDSKSELNNRNGRKVKRGVIDNTNNKKKVFKKYKCNKNQANINNHKSNEDSSVKNKTPQFGSEYVLLENNIYKRFRIKCKLVEVKIMCQRLDTSVMQQYTNKF